MHWFIRTISENDLTDALRDVVLELVDRTKMPVETVLANLLDALAPWEGLRTAESVREWRKYRGGEEVVRKTTAPLLPGEHYRFEMCPRCDKTIRYIKRNEAWEHLDGLEHDSICLYHPSKQSASKGLVK